MRTLYHPARNEITLGTVLYALSDPIRLEIVTNLAGGSEMTCSAMEVDLAKSTLSHHVKVLREAGVTSTRIEGTQRFISLRQEDLEARFPGLLPAILQATQGPPTADR